MGDAVMMPTRIKIDEPDPKPDSNDVSFTAEWSTPHSTVDVASVLDIWRKQGITNEKQSKYFHYLLTKANKKLLFLEGESFVFH